jgi:hypothetical protein
MPNTVNKTEPIRLTIAQQKMVGIKTLLKLSYAYATLDVMTAFNETGKGFNGKMTEEHMAIRIKQILREESDAIKLLTEH